MLSIIDILYKNFQEDHTNSRRFPGFPGVVDTLTLHLRDCISYIMKQQWRISQYISEKNCMSSMESQFFLHHLFNWIGLWFGLWNGML